MRSYCIASAKGGSGKTVIATTIATAAARLGFSCLLIDADPSTNGMTLLHLEQLIEQTRKSSGLFDSEEPDSFSLEYGTEAIGEPGRLDLIPATRKLHNTSECSPEDFDSRLRTVLAKAAKKNGYDYVFVDAQAGIEGFSLKAIDACDETIIVSEYDPVSARGVERFKLLASQSVDLSETWVLFNKVLPELSTKLGDFLAISKHLPPILWSADVVRSYVRSELALDLENPQVFSLGILDTASILLGKPFRQAVEAWKIKAGGLIATTLEAKRAVLIEALEHEENSLTRKRFSRSLISATGLIGVAATIWVFAYQYFDDVSFNNNVFLALIGAVLAASISSVFSGMSNTRSKEYWELKEQIGDIDSRLVANLEEQIRSNHE